MFSRRTLRERSANRREGTAREQPWVTTHGEYDIASDGITANAVLRGLMNTLAAAPQSEVQKRAIWEQQAIKRLGEPGDMTGRFYF